MQVDSKFEYSRVDYNRFCDDLERLLDRKSSSYIIASGLAGGMGHKYLSQLTALFTALNTDRQLYSKHNHLQFSRNILHF